MFKNYLEYLDFVNTKLDGFFKRQKDYIFCQKGCAKCCKNAEFPYSRTEFNYLLEGFYHLDDKTKKTILEKAKAVAEEKTNFTGEIFKYDCPFLVDNVCSVYEHRGVICRAFGLISIGADDRMKMPFCAFEGLNYSNVLDKEQNMVSDEKYRQTGIEEEPVAFNTSYKFLTSSGFEVKFNFTFGDKKPLIDFLIEDMKKLI